MCYLLTLLRVHTRARTRAHTDAHTHKKCAHITHVTFQHPHGVIIIYESIYLCLVRLYTQVLRSHNWDNYKTTTGPRLFYSIYPGRNGQWVRKTSHTIKQNPPQKKRFRVSFTRLREWKCIVGVGGWYKLSKPSYKGITKDYYSLPPPNPPFPSTVLKGCRCHYM